MNELIKITERDGRQAVSARELHAFLGNKKQFANWIKERIEKYGLVENQDYIRFNQIVKTTGGRLIEYALTIDCAKELAMVEGNAKGRQARKYFIERDKELRAIERGEVLPASLEKEVQSLKEQVERLAALRPGVNEFTVHGYASLVKKRLYGSEAITVGKRAVKRCKELKLPVNNVRDPRFGMVNTYPEEVLEEVFREYFKQPRF